MEKKRWTKFDHFNCFGSRNLKGIIKQLLEDTEDLFKKVIGLNRSIEENKSSIEDIKKNYWKKETTTRERIALNQDLEKPYEHSLETPLCISKRGDLVTLSGVLKIGSNERYAIIGKFPKGFEPPANTLVQAAYSTNAGLFEYVPLVAKANGDLRLVDTIDSPIEEGEYSPHIFIGGTWETNY